MKKLLKFLIFIAILAGAAFGVKMYFFDKPVEETVGAFVSASVTKDTIATTISATGTLKPVDQVEVGTQVSGDIAKLFVDFNSKVTQGQVIAELDKSKLQATLDQALISFKNAEIEFKFKKSTYERIKKLAESKSASAVELEQAEYNMNSAQFSLERSKNEVAQARLNLSYATIKSPIDGVVLERSVDVGQTVAASMSAPTLFVIAKDLSQMKVMAAVDEADIGSVKPGQRVDFTVDAFQDDKFHGSVQEVRLNPTTTSNVVTYTVVITAENNDLKLLPGMTATCTIVTNEVPDAISIPVKALKFTPSLGRPKSGKFGAPDGAMDGPPPMDNPPPMGGEPPPFPGMGGGAGSTVKKPRPPKPFPPGTQVVWVNLNGHPVPRPIKTGINNGVNIEVQEGLSVGDSVIVSQETATTKKTTKSDNRSPFMPGPPGQKGKKGK